MPTTFSIRDLGLQAGQARQENLDVEIIPYHQAGTDYRPPAGTVPARIDVTAMTSGLAFRLRLQTDMHGPCARCLEDAVLSVVVDAVDVHDPDAGDPELESDFVVGDELDVTLWAQDAVGLEFPARVLCRDDCQGLCPMCGINQNEATCDCDLAVVDNRWDKLRELQLELGDDDADAATDAPS